MAILQDGFKTIITLAQGTLDFEEVDVTPPGIQGGGANESTNMRNTAWRTKNPKKLKTLTDASLNVHYDPELLSTIVAQINVNQKITVTFPDDSKLEFWGWLDQFTPQALAEGAKPTASITIIPSNQTDAGAEFAPTYVAPV